MKNLTQVLTWATDYLISEGYSLEHSPEIVAKTPWSQVIRFLTSTGNFYLKQTPPLLFLESKILELLSNQLHANVPIVIASNDDLHCFLMKGAGISLREYLRTGFQPDLLLQAIKHYTAIQRLTENHIESFLALGVPDWRLDKIPTLYDQLISQAEFLKAESITNEELKILHNLSPKISAQCELLSQYQIPETVVQPDFNTNNILFDPNTQKMTLIDLGEIVITHPFFSLHNFLYQATLHHAVKESSQIYHQLQNTCCEPWLASATQKQLLDGLMLIKKLWPIYFVLAHHRLMKSVDQQALKSWDAHRPNRLAGYFREYIKYS